MKCSPSLLLERLLKMTLIRNNTSKSSVQEFNNTDKRTLMVQIHLRLLTNNEESVTSQSPQVSDLAVQPLARQMPSTQPLQLIKTSHLINKTIMKRTMIIKNSDLKMKMNQTIRRCHSAYNRFKGRAIKGLRVSIGDRHSMQRMDSYRLPMAHLYSIAISSHRWLGRHSCYRGNRKI
jgi:Neuraminidase (sialidase)